jgi:Bacterial TSP3 repeat
MPRKIFAFLGTKIGISLLASIAIVGSAFTLKDVTLFGEKGTSEPSLTTEGKATQQAFEKDSDNDGLKDWEEALYGTDPKNPDTRGHGLGDLKEIERERASSTSAIGVSAKATSTITATDRFSRELFTKYLEAKRAGQEITPELSASIAADLTSKSYDQELPPFDASILKTTTNADPEFIRSYGNLVGTILSTPMPEGVSSELFILDKIMTNRGASAGDLSDVSKLIDRYTTIHDKLVAMKIPVGAKEFHAQIVQAIELLRNAVVGIKSIEADPIGALPKIALYENGVNLLGASSFKFKRYFDTEGVFFSEDEKGIILTR